MIIWIDAQLSPHLAAWITEELKIEARSVSSLGYRDAEDSFIFRAARQVNAVVMTKDRDFVSLLEQLGQPPQVIWVTCGNTSNQNLRRILKQTLREAIQLLENGEPLVEISDPL